ncbi:hypothetical protein ABES01_23515 [Paenibacillus rhizolycopersici]|uniref:DUF7448 domain-containing protein n=1 Tax=Paenibacillus rhizolycopersici TaxID=2780073 RepID=UPI003D28C8F0
MAEIIQKIEEITEKHRYSVMAGYAIHTDKQVIKLLIDDESQCCESWGYFLSEENLESFIGAELIGISLTDTALNSHTVDVEEIDEEASIMFVNIETSAGLLQFTAYNAHNGYYGHDARVISHQLTHEETL